MPRKTKKQKARAQQAWVVKREFTYSPTSTGSEAKSEKRIDKSRSLTQETFYVPDLVRTIVLALIILGLELMLYWSGVNSAL